jgi:hypothetical protein
MGYNDHRKELPHEAKQALPIPKLSVGRNHVVSDGRLLAHLDLHPRIPELLEVIYQPKPSNIGFRFFSQELHGL